INNNIVTEVGNNYIILKTEESDVTKKYMQFYTAGSDFSYYLGHRVEMKYRYNPDGGASGRYEIESVKSKETIIKEINAGNIKRDKTIQKNEGEGRRVVWYTDGNEDYELSLGTDDVNNLKVIYNNKVVDTTATPLTIDDFMPESGKIMVVDENTDGSIDLVWIESYETYVVGTKSFNTTPKKITDKFRTDSDGHALVLELDDSGDNVSVRQNGEEIEVTSITQNMILTVAQSKCGLEIDISAQKTSTASIVIASVKTVGGVKKAFNAKSGKVYNFSDYFTKYVDPSLDYEVGDNLTIYLNGSNEVVWATVAEPTYNFGYLISASYNETTEKLNLKILSSGGSVSMFTMADSRTSYITKAINYLDEVGVTPNSVSNPNGYLYKNLNVRHIWESLKENAATINEGKSSAIKLNSATSQPIRYVISSGTEISTLLTLELDTENSFRGESLTYENDANTGRMLFKTDDNSKTFSAETKSMVVFVPNNRDLEAAHYKIGAISSLPTTRKFVEYMKYNIEPYFITDSTGAKQRSVFVVYNESIDAQPTYRSENVIVEKVEETNPSGTLTYVIHGYLKSNTSVNKKYNCYTRSIIERAYVLDENFERTGERRAIETGDVIRIGTTPAGHVANIELIFDASEEFKSSAAKAVAVSNESTLLDSLNPSKNYVFYYARIGEIVNIDSSDTPESCDILIGALGTSNVFIGPTFNTTKVLLFDHTATDLPSTEKNEKFKEIKMEELWGGEILFIWQGAKLQRQQMYAVRYPVVQTQPETPGGDGDENGAEGGANGGEDNTTGEDNNQNGDGTTGDDTTGDGDDTQSGENGSENGGENNPQDLDV
ncbi:MAG: hypothetical protein IKW02_00465, partial [Clostridia bacterium]|nr:hypothetical protein [Clostridia bacterium]